MVHMRLPSNDVVYRYVVGLGRYFGYVPLIDNYSRGTW